MPIRLATLADAPALATLSHQLGYPVDAPAMTSRLAHLLSRDTEAVFLAETPSGSVTGWIHAAEQELLETGTRCEILGLVVDQLSRRRGIGRALVAEAERWATQRSLAEISVRSAVARRESHPFYQALGYTRVKTQHVYRKQLTDSGAL